MDTLAVLDALYGDGAWEISKSLAAKPKNPDREKKLAAAGLAGNAVAVTGGVHAMYLAGKNPALRGKSGKVALASGAGWIGLHSVELAADGLGGRALHHQYKSAKAQTPTVVKPKKFKKVTKSDKPIGATKPNQLKLKLLKKSVTGAGTAAKAAPGVAEEIQTKLVKKSVDLAIRGEVCKMNKDLQQVFGWASVIEMDGEPIIDLQGDVMTIETIEKAAYSYVHGSRKGGRQHARDGEEPLHVSDMIESFVLTPEKKEKMGIPDSVPTGWWCGFKINDADTWADFKSGKLKDFSIHGSGTRNALALDDA